MKDPNFSYSIEKVYHTKLQPNIVFFLVDDWGYNDFGLTSINHLQGTTPNIDRLAKEGIRLTNYYTYELCTPSRAAFLTGRYAFRFGLQGNNTNCKGVLPTTAGITFHIICNNTLHTSYYYYNCSYYRSRVKIGWLPYLSYRQMG